MTPISTAAAARRGHPPPRRGRPRAGDLRRHPPGPRGGRLRPPDHGRRRRAGPGVQGDALPPLERQGRARHRRAAVGRRARTRCPTPARCAATCSRRSAASAASPTTARWRRSPACSPRSAATPSSPRPSASKFIAPKAAIGRAIFERARDRGELREGLDLDLIAPALAGICLHRMFLMGLPPDQDVIARVVDQIILPAALADRRDLQTPKTLQEN